MRSILYTLCFLCIFCYSFAFAEEKHLPDCSGPERWAASSVGVKLKNLNMSKKAGGYDKIEVKLLASERITYKVSDKTIFRQVHKVIIHDQGSIFTAITVNDASYQECSESGVDVYFISIECNADSKCQSYKAP